MIYHARFVVPVDVPAVEGGALEVTDGKISATGPTSEFFGKPHVDFGDAVLIPGLVNAHTHLELSLLENRVAPTPDFADWLNRLIATRTQDVRDSGPPQIASNTYFERAVRAGISKSLAAGVTTVGDITAVPACTRAVLAASPLRAVSFGEVIAMGTGRHQLDTRLAAAADQSLDSDRFRAGISPHSPYTVEPFSLRECVHRAAQGGFPLCIHAAETMEEEQFTRDGRGEFARFLQGLGLWDDQVEVPHAGPIEWLSSVGALTSRTLLAHANYVSDRDIDLIAASGASVAYCPHTHAAFGHPPHRFRDMLRAGINVCLGTDSLASNPSLSMLDELRFVASMCSDMTPHEILSLATLRGARALGMEYTSGSLTPGKSADFVVIPLSPNVRNWDSIMMSTDRTSKVFINGRDVSADTPS
jgi:cytosine/adenosine deaminase-related metal-dependent hydrolase